MLSEPVKKGVIFLTLGLLTVSAFFVRLENFTNSRARSIDEVVYYRMARQFYQDPSHYNTIPYGQDLAARGRPLPRYFFEPLFKYPPLFTMMIASSFYFFGIHVNAAYYVVLIFGILTIPLTYALGRLVYDRRVGLCAAFFVAIDPVSIITSQKLWPDTPLAFFSLLSIYYFARGLSARSRSAFILSGLTCGLAILIKYSAVFILIAYGVFALFKDRGLYKHGPFWMNLIIPFVMLVPWLYWNYTVYGWDFIGMQIGLHSKQSHQLLMRAQLALAGMVLFIGAMIGLWLRANRDKWRALREDFKANKQGIIYGCLGAAVILLGPYVYHAVQITAIPATGWSPGMFKQEPFYFYLGRLLEYSLIYAFGYAAYVFGKNERNGLERSLLWINAVVLGLYMFWTNFQSRYILVCLPLLLILASHRLLMAGDWIRLLQPYRKKILFFSLITVCVLFILIKTTLINLHLSFPNDLCYY